MREVLHVTKLASNKNVDSRRGSARIEIGERDRRERKRMRNGEDQTKIHV